MSISVVRLNNLYCNKQGLIIPLDTQIFTDWLLINKSFRYESSIGKSHFSKDKKGYWTAIKHINNKRRQKRMGTSFELTSEALQNVTYRLNLSDEDYQQWLESSKQERFYNSRFYLKLRITYLEHLLSLERQKTKELEHKMDKVEHPTERLVYDSWTDDNFFDKNLTVKN